MLVQSQDSRFSSIFHKKRLKSDKINQNSHNINFATLKTKKNDSPERYITWFLSACFVAITTLLVLSLSPSRNRPVEGNGHLNHELKDKKADLGSSSLAHQFKPNVPESKEEKKQEPNTSNDSSDESNLTSKQSNTTFNKAKSNPTSETDSVQDCAQRLVTGSDITWQDIQEQHEEDQIGPKDTNIIFIDTPPKTKEEQEEDFKKSMMEAREKFQNGDDSVWTDFQFIFSWIGNVMNPNVPIRESEIPNEAELKNLKNAIRQNLNLEVLNANNLTRMEIALELQSCLWIIKNAKAIFKIDDFENVKYIIIGHGTGSFEDETWKFSNIQNGSVTEFIKTRVPEGEKALMYVCQTNNLAIGVIGPYSSGLLFIAESQGKNELPLVSMCKFHPNMQPTITRQHFNRAAK